MSALFSGPPSIPTPVIPAPAPQKSDAEVQAADSAARQRLAGASGRGSTILTATDTAPKAAPTRTLLGSAA